MSRTNNPNIDNTNADTAVEVNVVSTQFNNVSEGGNIGGNTGARLYLSENGEARLVQKNILFQQAAKLYDFDKGEWTKYTVRVNSSGIYRIRVRHASEQNGGKLYLSLNDQNVSSILTTNSSGSWFSFITSTIDLSLIHI